jgi:hypothetical protein
VNFLPGTKKKTRKNICLPRERKKRELSLFATTHQAFNSGTFELKVEVDRAESKNHYFIFRFRPDPPDVWLRTRQNKFIISAGLGPDHGRN